MPSTSAAEEAYEDTAAAFTKRNPRSKSLYDQACQSMPGGNVRTVLYYHPFPLSIAKGKGSIITDVDGHDYVDLLGEYTAGLYGHSDPTIKAAIIDSLNNGISYGGQHENEHRLATLIKQRFPSIDLIRFTNSGTEANLMNMTLACAVTGRKKIIVFNGGYHGGCFGWKNGKASPVNAPFQFLVANYNDTESVKLLLEDPNTANDLAAIVVEPMIGSGGGMPGTYQFLSSLRGIADGHNAVLIFDEVMTSRLFNGGGYQSQLPEHCWPDLTSFGKYMGGGMSFGAFGGKESLMSRFDPRQPGNFAHAGTFNNNVLTMAAGSAGLEHVFTPRRAIELHNNGEKLREQLREACQDTIMQWTGCGSIICVHFTTLHSDQITCPDDIAGADRKMADLFHLFLLDHGYHIGRRGFLALSIAVTEYQLTGFVETVKLFIEKHAPLLVLN